MEPKFDENIVVAIDFGTTYILDCFWENIMNLTWSQDGALTCCMDCLMEDLDYDSDDSKQSWVRLVTFNNTTLSYNEQSGE